MARSRDPRRDEAKKIWLDSDRKIKLKDLADQLGVTSSTIRKWKSVDKWEEETPVNKKTASTRKTGAPKGNKNATGNKGGAPKQNQNAVTHGFFSKYLPEETMEIMEEIRERSPVDMIWDQIQIQYAAIIRAQQIMFVKDKHDMTKVLRKSKESFSKNGGSTEEEYELQFAHDKHANFMNAQSRAMSTLSNLIKNFLQISGKDDKRRLELEKMQQDIDISKQRFDIEKDKWSVEKDKLTDDKNKGPIQILVKRKGDS
jgi:uncharacterized protein YjcR